MALIMLPMEQIGRDDDKESQGPDRFSELPDHILLCVLQRLGDDARSLARICVLSKRWRTLPLMLPELEISARTFLPAQRHKLERAVIHATCRFVDAVRFFLATGGDDHSGYQRAIIKTLRLNLYLTDVDCLLDTTVRLIGDAVGRDEVQDLELMVDTEMLKKTLLRADQIEEGDDLSVLYGRRFTRLLRDAPAAVLGSLKKLTLQDLFFPDPSSEVVGTLLHACGALEALSLGLCGFIDGDSKSTLTIDAPRSRLKVLSFDNCFVGSVHIAQAPRLARLIGKEWFSESCPVTFGPGSVPSLEEIVLSNRARAWDP